MNFPVDILSKLASSKSGHWGLRFNKIRGAEAAAVLQDMQSVPIELLRRILDLKNNSERITPQDIEKCPSSLFSVLDVRRAHVGFFSVVEPID